MVNVHVRMVLNTLFVVSGALLIGQMLNDTIVTGQATLLGPSSVIKFTLGVIFIGLGYLVKATPSEQKEAFGIIEDSGDNADTEFDPEMSPIGGEPPKSDRDDDE
jgi:dipeptide/tripeptide permease